MDKLIINTPIQSDYSNVICTFIRAGFSINQFAINNTLLIVEISSFNGVRVSNCDYAIIAQSIYEIAATLGIDNITMQHDGGAYTIADDGVTKVIANRIKYIRRAEELAKCYAIVQAEQLAEDIAANILFLDCKKRLYHIDYAQYDAATLCKTLAQFGITSYIIQNTHNLVIA